MHLCVSPERVAFIQILCHQRLDHYLSDHHQQYLLHAVHQQISVSATANSSSCTSIEHRLAGVKELKSTLEILAKGFHVIDDDVQRLSNESVAQRNVLSTLIRESSALKVSVEEQTLGQNQIVSHQEMTTNEFQSMSKSLKQMNLISRDRTFMWRIEHVAQKIGQ